MAAQVAQLTETQHAAVLESLLLQRRPKKGYCLTSDVAAKKKVCRFPFIRIVRFHFAPASPRFRELLKLLIPRQLVFLRVLGHPLRACLELPGQSHLKMQPGSTDLVFGF